MNEHTVAEYESGWYVEKADHQAPLEDCVFIQVAGPYKRRETAQRKCDELNLRRPPKSADAWAINSAYEFARKLK